MQQFAPRLPLSLDPLIAEAKRRMRRRRLLVFALAVVLAGGTIGVVLALRGPSHPRFSVSPTSGLTRTPVGHIGSGPFVLNGGFASGGGSGLWGDGASGPHGTTLGCLNRRHYSEAFGIQNRSHTAVTLIAARGANPAPAIVERVAVQFRLSPPVHPTPGRPPGLSLVYRHWSATPTRPLRIPPGRNATVQSNFLFRHCGQLAGGRSITVPGSLVLRYRLAGSVHQKTVPLPGERFILIAGPQRRQCSPVSGSGSLVSADTSCAAAQQAALACHPMSHNSWGDCSVAGVLWDCGSTAGRGWPYLETCWQPTKKSHWFRVRWNPPILSSKGIGGVAFGTPRGKVIARLSELLGTRSSAPPTNRACGPASTEVAWQHLYVELRHGRMVGFRYIANGWPGKPQAASHLPSLITTLGITLGSTLRQARRAYGHLRPVGTNRWETPDGLVLYDNARRYPDPPASRIIEIKYGTCGDF